MSWLLAIDPGNEESAWALIDTVTCRPHSFGKVPNDDLRQRIWRGTFFYDHAAVEMVASYGMPVGRDVFETCVWIGRFVEAIVLDIRDAPALISRRDVKVHHCHDSRAKDSNITQALVDRFAPGQPNKGKGTKANPGWFYGFAKDVWQAYALAVREADKLEGRQP